MAIDFLAPFGEDMSFGPGPDISLAGTRSIDFNFVDSQAELIQRIVRRLLTNRGEWIPFPNYGASLRRWVDEALSSQDALSIRADIVAQVTQEPDVASIPAPVVTLEAIPDGLFVTISLYTLAQEPVSFSFNPNAPDIFAHPAGDILTAIRGGTSGG